MMRVAIFVFSIIVAIHSYGLSPVAVNDFYKNISMSPDIEIGVWSGRGDLCMQKAKETGYLMLWFIYENQHKTFLENDLCRQKFCDLINDYKYIILCCENYSNTAVYDRKNSIYGYPEPSQILNESTGQYERNHNGYPVYSGLDEAGKERYCDHGPSIHLLKFDSSANVIFHICSGIANYHAMVYDEKFSPYAARFPIPNAMCTGTAAHDKFAPWLKLYLDLYPVQEQITTYENAGGDTQVSPTAGSSIGTNYIYEVVEIAVTETVNPTVYQIAQRRDNLLFRAVTTVGDVLVKQRIYDVFSTFDERSIACSADGKWFVNHDDTVSAIVSKLSSSAMLDIVTTSDCTLQVNQREGNGFTFAGYDYSTTTNVTVDSTMSEIGTMIQVTVTNIDTIVSSTPFIKRDVGRNTTLSEYVSKNRLYRISVNGNSTFDVLSTK